MADARRLAELSMVPPLAKEVAAQIDDAAGAGAVASVNGQTGAVVLDAADVGAATEAYVDARLSAAQRTAIDALTGGSTAADIVAALQAV